MVRQSALFFLGLWLVAMGCVELKTQPRSSYIQNENLLGANLINQDQDLDLALKNLENGIIGNQELLQYSKALPYFSSKKEQVEFLSLKSFKKRQLWLNSVQFWTRPQEQERRFSETVKAQDIAIGMNQDLLAKSWGEPGEVFISGLKEFKNARWIYKKQLSTSEGFKQQKRVVYIEAGKVTGWDIE